MLYARFTISINIGNTVHITHFRMAVQLYTLLCTVDPFVVTVKSFDLLDAGYLIGNRQITYQSCPSAQQSPDLEQKSTFLDTFPAVSSGVLRCGQNILHFDRVRKVCNKEADDRLFITDWSRSSTRSALCPRIVISPISSSDLISIANDLTLPHP